jgi:hypothetical protein
MAAVALATVLARVTEALVFTEPLSSQATPTPLPLAVAPPTARPGQSIHVFVSGLAGLPIAGNTGCLGILGPGQNVEAPLATIAEATISIIGPTPIHTTWPGLPATGGVPDDRGVPAAAAIGLVATLLGLLLRTSTRSSGDGADGN